MLRNIATKRLYSIKLPNHANQVVVKPRISQFSHALYNTFMMSISTFFLLNIIYNNLIYQDIEQDLRSKSEKLEQQIQEIVNQKNEQLTQYQEKNRGWLSKLKFW